MLREPRFFVGCDGVGFASASVKRALECRGLGWVEAPSGGIRPRWLRRQQATALVRCEASRPSEVGDLGQSELV